MKISDFSSQLLFVIFAGCHFCSVQFITEPNFNYRLTDRKKGNGNQNCTDYIVKINSYDNISIMKIGNYWNTKLINNDK